MMVAGNPQILAAGGVPGRGWYVRANESESRSAALAWALPRGPRVPVRLVFDPGRRIYPADSAFADLAQQDGRVGLAIGAIINGGRGGSAIVATFLEPAEAIELAAKIVEPMTQLALRDRAVRRELKAMLSSLGTVGQRAFLTAQERDRARRSR